MRPSWRRLSLSLSARSRSCQPCSLSYGGGVGFRILGRQHPPSRPLVDDTLDGRAIALERLCCDAGHRDAEVRVALKGFASITPVVFDQGGAGLELAAEGSVGRLALLHQYLGLTFLAHFDRRTRLRNEHLESVIAATTSLGLPSLPQPSPRG